RIVRAILRRRRLARSVTPRPASRGSPRSYSNRMAGCLTAPSSRTAGERAGWRAAGPRRQRLRRRPPFARATPRRRSRRQAPAASACAGGAPSPGQLLADGAGGRPPPPAFALEAGRGAADAEGETFPIVRRRRASLPRLLVWQRSHVSARTHLREQFLQ